MKNITQTMATRVFKDIARNVIPASLRATPEVSPETASARLESIARQYRNCVDAWDDAAVHYQLDQEILEAGTRALDMYRSFKPHPDADHERKVAAWAKTRHIWSERYGTSYITMTRFLHPLAEISPDRLELAGQFNAYLFYINDVYGTAALAAATDTVRTAAKRLLSEHRLALEEILARREESAYLEADFDLGNAHQVTRVGIELLRSFFRYYKSNDRLAEFFDFVTKTVAHLELGLSEQNVDRRRAVYGVEEYMHSRLHVSGMYTTIHAYEFLPGAYVDLERIADDEVAIDLVKLGELSMWAGSFLNDLFSFDKELIRDRSEYNLVSVIAMNAGEDLHGSIKAAIGIVRDVHMEFFELLRRLETHAWGSDLEGSARLFMRSCDEAVRASYVWELITNRYGDVFEHGISLFRENDARFVAEYLQRLRECDYDPGVVTAFCEHRMSQVSSICRT